MEFYYSLIFLLIFIVVIYLVVRVVDSFVKPYDLGTKKVTRDVMGIQEFREALLKHLNVEIKDTGEDIYYVAYQGGNFSFAFSKDNCCLNITYPSFAEIKYEKFNKSLEAINSVNLRHYWTSFLTYSGDTEIPISASCNYFCALHSSPEESAKAISDMLIEPFYIAREFNDELGKHDERSPLITDVMHKLQYDSLHMQLEQTGDDEPKKTTVSHLLELTKDVDFGCMLGLRVVREESVETISEPGTILAFDFEEYVKEHHKECDRFTFLLDFEKDSLVVDIHKNAGGTERHLIYNMSAVRSGGYLDEKCSSYCFCTMFEVHLTTAEEDYWEAKYMLEEMAADAAFCNYASSLDEHTRFSMYWGMKFYNNGAYLQALGHLKKVYHSIPDPQDEKTIHAYCFVSEMIGSIYMRLGMPDTAISYMLSLAMGMCIERLYPLVASCFSCTNDIAALDGLMKMRHSIIESMGKENESVYNAVDTMKVYLLLNRKIVELLIKRGKKDEAKDFLENMIRNGEDVEWANTALENL